MTNPVIIPTNFRVPKQCRHEFLIYWNNHKMDSIRGVPGKRKLEFTTWNLSCTEEEEMQFNAKTFDWMSESVQHLRGLCQQ